MLLLKHLLKSFENGDRADVDAAIDQRRDVRRRLLDVVQHRVCPRVRDDAAVVQRLLPEHEEGLLCHVHCTTLNGGLNGQEN